MDATTPTIGHNSSSYLQMIEADPDLVYRDAEALEKAVAEIEARIAAATIDLATTKGRDEIKSRAADLSRLKVQIENAGLKRTEEWRKATDVVNATKKKAKTRFDELRDKARKPLTEWEEAKQKREDEINAVIAKIDGMALISPDMTAQAVRDRLEWLSILVINEEGFGAFEPIAAGKRARVTDTLNAALARIEQAERDKAELDRLRAEKEALERAAAEAEAKALAEKAEQDRIADIAAKAADAERRKAQAEIDAANERAAEIQRQADQAERDRLEEQKRKDDAAEAQRLADEARQKDIEHRGTVMRAAKEAIMEHGGVKEAAAKAIVLAIVAGSIPHTSIKF